jgi:hypothetical protein
MVFRVRSGVLAALALAGLTAGCGSGGGSGLEAPKIGAARTFQLAGFRPSTSVRAGVPTTLSFHIQQPSGGALTKFKTGPGPHTGVHLIIVRKDLSTIIHRHPPIARDGSISLPVTFPAPGPYRVLVDIYPDVGPNTQPNFQLFANVDVQGSYHPKPLPGFHSAVTVDGDHFVMRTHSRLKSLKPEFLNVTVTDGHGRRASFTPWYGALAHAIFFRSGTLAYFHTHVCGAGAANCTSVLGGSKVTGHSNTPGKLTVGVLLPLPGVWRLFLQSRVDGRIVTAPFTLKVA